MKKVIFVLAGLILLCIALYAVAYINADAVNNYFVEKETKAMVLAALVDPNSAQFRNVSGRCGEVNSKNRMGGYSGFDKYVVVGSKVYFQSNEANLPLFWKNVCPEI